METMCYLRRFLEQNFTFFSSGLFLTMRMRSLHGRRKKLLPLHQPPKVVLGPRGESLLFRLKRMRSEAELLLLSTMVSLYAGSVLHDRSARWKKNIASLQAERH